jgi:invasion protein IalB
MKAIIGVRKFSLAAAFGLIAVSLSGSAIAQTKKPTPAPAPAAPAAPAQPATPAAAPAAIVQVQPEPTQADWIKICGEDQAAKKKICYTTRDFVSDQNQPVLAVAVYDIQGEPQKVVRLLLPLGFILAPGVRVTVDQGTAQPGKYAVCFPNGCFAEVPVKDDVIAALKKGTSLAISVQNQFAREVIFQVPLSTFGKVFDGPPIDPAVLQAQQQKLQEQMQKQAEEMRKKMETQGQGATPPAAPIQPAAPAQ